MTSDIRVLLPFAKAADDYEPPKSKRRYRDEEHVALSLTAGHLREARRVILKLIESTTDEREVKGGSDERH